jgi:hypothetical protein
LPIDRKWGRGLAGLDALLVALLVAVVVSVLLIGLIVVGALTVIGVRVVGVIRLVLRRRSRILWRGDILLRGGNDRSRILRYLLLGRTA